MKKIINILIKKHIFPKYDLKKKYNIKDLSYYPYENNTIIIKFELTREFKSITSLENEMLGIMKSVGLYGTASLIQNTKGNTSIFFAGSYCP
jgi:hypothetical protein